ncbi:MAG: hypothetical protein ABI548_09870 [Polyangiaceae bacterium]
MPARHKFATTQSTLLGLPGRVARRRVLGECVGGWDVGCCSEEVGESDCSSGHGGEDCSPFQDRASTLELGVFDPVVSENPDGAN